MLSFRAQQRQHGLVAAMHAVEVADRHGAGVRQGSVVETAKDFHGDGGLSSRAGPASWENGYIVAYSVPAVSMSANGGVAALHKLSMSIAECQEAFLEGLEAVSPGTSPVLDLP